MTRLARLRSKGPALALVTLLLAACGNRGGEAPRGRFSLVRTQAGELPALLGERGGCRYEAVGGFVELNADSLYTAELHRRRVCDPAEMADTITVVDTTFVDQGDGRYHVEGDSILFRYSEGALAGVGAMHGDTLVVQGPGQTLYYRRQGR